MSALCLGVSEDPFSSRRSVIALILPFALSLLTAPYLTPSDELFKRASSFQESLEAELKTHYKTADILNIARSCWPC